MEENPISGTIYVITNKINGKKYVGQTVSKFNLRKNSHIYKSKQKNNCGISAAISKYGIDNFEFEVVECNINSMEKLNNREKHWINKLNTFCGWVGSHGYNLTNGGDNGLLCEESKQKISDHHYDFSGGKNPRSKEVVINGKKYECITYAAKELGVQRSTIRRWLNGDKSCSHGEKRKLKREIVLDGEKFASLTEAGIKYGVKYNTVWKWIKNGRGYYI